MFEIVVQYSLQKVDYHSKIVRWFIFVLKNIHWVKPLSVLWRNQTFNAYILTANYNQSMIILTDVFLVTKILYAVWIHVYLQKFY